MKVLLLKQKEYLRLFPCECESECQVVIFMYRLTKRNPDIPVYVGDFLFISQCNIIMDKEYHH